MVIILVIWYNSLYSTHYLHFHFTLMFTFLWALLKRYIFVNLYIRLTTSIPTHLQLIILFPSAPIFSFSISSFSLPHNPTFWDPFLSIISHWQPHISLPLPLSNFHFAYFSPRYHGQYPLSHPSHNDSSPIEHTTKFASYPCY